MKTEDEIRACMFGIELMSDELDSNAETLHKFMEWLVL
jgi:hypothetical protein